ncbi:MAG: hypothetical protein U1F33_12165 [Alphaproteobacteria bacterium]
MRSSRERRATRGRGARACGLVATAGALLAAAGTALGADWVSLGGTASTQGAVDRASIAVEKKQLQAWALFRFAAPQPSPAGEYRSQRSLSYFKCADHSIAYVEHHLYASDDGSGEAVYTVTSAPGEITFAKPEAGTMGERIVTFVCTEAAKKRSKQKG